MAQIPRRNFTKLLGGGLLAPLAAAAQSTPIPIREAKLYHLQAPVEHAVRTSFGIMTARHLVLLELRDELGNRGFGESWINFPAWAPAERIAAFRTAFLPYLKGKEVAGIPEFVRNMAKAFRGPAVQSGTVGPLMSSLCAIEMALIELEAKRKRLPIAKLLFSSPSSKVRIYGSGIGIGAPMPWKQIDRYLDCGATLFKLKIGFGDDSDLANIKELKKHLGSKAKLAVDVNRNWTFRQAKEWVKRLADFEIQWLEEPLSVEEESSTQELSAISAVPLAGGENILVEPGSDILPMAASPFAILQPDMTKYFTTHDFLRLLPEAAKRRKRVIPHLLGSAPGQAFSTHLAAGCAGDPLVEWDVNANPLHTSFFKEEFLISAGTIEIPETPGLGWTPKLQPADQVA
jgi:D-galactarolactone cycloisomerase